MILLNLILFLFEPPRSVDASQAGEGQLEIAINDGAVPNHVQVLGGGRCLGCNSIEKNLAWKSTWKITWMAIDFLY